jgi:hypothetical protein
MGDRSHSRSSGLPLIIRLLSVVAMLTVLCVSHRASAAPLLGTAPMCGERNESVAAPPIFRALDDSAIDVSPCQASSDLVTGQSAPRAPDRVIVHERPERVLGSAGLYVAEGASTLLQVDECSAALPRAGFAEALYRPPRA